MEAIADRIRQIHWAIGGTSGTKEAPKRVRLVMLPRNKSEGEELLEGCILHVSDNGRRSGPDRGEVSIDPRAGRNGSRRGPSGDAACESRDRPCRDNVDGRPISGLGSRGSGKIRSAVVSGRFQAVEDGLKNVLPPLGGREIRNDSGEWCGHRC